MMEQHFMPQRMPPIEECCRRSFSPQILLASEGLMSTQPNPYFKPPMTPSLSQLGQHILWKGTMSLLVQRVRLHIRLPLFLEEQPPSRILCITLLQNPASALNQRQRACTTPRQLQH